MAPLPPLSVTVAILSALGLREPVAALSHLAAALAAPFAASVLWRRSRDDRAKQISMLVYGCSLVILFLASAAYHGVAAGPGPLDVLRRIDHSAIFLLIAGTFTPSCFNGARGLWRAGPLGVVWGIALLGVAVKWLRVELSDEASAGLYMGLGLVALLGYVKPAAVISARAVAWTTLGGAIYCAGAVIDIVGWPWGVPGVFGPHEVFHVAVVLASALCYAVLLRYVVPAQRPRAVEASGAADGPALVPQAG